MMKIKRVGTISMSIILIIFGVTLFLSQINKFSALNMVLNVWPMILILIGLEILWYRYLSKDKEIVIKYDLFSIFIILVILLMNIGIFAISESGLTNKMQSTLLTENYIMDKSINEYVIDENINKIIIDDATNIVIRATEDNKISGVSKMNVYAVNKEEADKLASLDNISYEKSGKTLYIYSINNINNNYSYSNMRSLDIFLPDNIDVEVMNCYNLDLIFNDFKNQWTFDRVDNINIRLDKISDVTIKAFVDSVDLLSGNITWSFNNFGEYVKGDGTKVINILDSSNIRVNEV